MLKYVVDNIINQVDEFICLGVTFKRVEDKNELLSNTNYYIATKKYKWGDLEVDFKYRLEIINNLAFSNVLKLSVKFCNYMAWHTISLELCDSNITEEYIIKSIEDEFILNYKERIIKNTFKSLDENYQQKMIYSHLSEKYNIPEIEIYNFFRYNSKMRY